MVIVTKEADSSTIGDKGLKLVIVCTGICSTKHDTELILMRKLNWGVCFASRH